MIPTSHSYDRVKRGIDIVGAGAGLIILSPVIGATALIIRLKLGSPVLFTQNRPGMNGKIFKLYKFRTMLNIDETKGLLTDEQRLTNFGKNLRSTSLDELPSLINVLLGDMSLIGPRPLLVSYLTRYSATQARRHEVRPGITGLAQVSGRNDISWNQKFSLDIKYVDERNLMLDLQIFWKTIRAVFVREGITQSGHATTREFMGQSQCR